MNIRRCLPACLGIYLLAISLPAIAQIPAVKTDSLHPGQAAQGAAGCSATEASWPRRRASSWVRAWTLA